MMTCPSTTGCDKDCFTCEHSEMSKLKPARGIVDMQLFMCGYCGAFITGFLDATDKYAPKYCPNCGKRLVL